MSLIVGFDAVVAQANIMALMSTLVLVAGICCVLGMMFKGHIGGALGAFAVSAVLFYVMAGNQMGLVGQMLAQQLTLDPGQQLSSPTGESSQGKDNTASKDSSSAVTVPGNQPANPSSGAVNPTANSKTTP